MSEVELNAQRERVVLHTQVDTWKTAAWMTVFLPLTGLPCALLCIPVFWGIRERIDCGETAAVEARLRLARRAIPAFAVISLMVFLALGIKTMLDVNVMFNAQEAAHHGF